MTQSFQSSLYSQLAESLPLLNKNNRLFSEAMIFLTPKLNKSILGHSNLNS